jgi:beta-galactosidase GanA
MKKTSNESFLYGASCAPYAKSMDYPQDQWEADLIQMKKMGFSLVRIFVAWDRVEQIEGGLDFSKQDYFMELAAKHQMNVLLNVGGAFDSLQGIYPPQWLIRKYKVQAPCLHSKEEGKHSGSRLAVCLDDPIYREKALEFIAKAVRRYADHHATAGWMVWNEPAVPPCYCPHTKTKFQEFLKKKYENNLFRLNELWGTEFPVNYEKWSMIEPSTGSGFRTGGLNSWKDWMEFSQFRLTEAIKDINVVIKANDKHRHTTTANLITARRFYNPPYLWRMSELYKSLDIIGFSLYTVAHGEGQGRTMSPLFNSLTIDFYRWYSQEKNESIWVLETEVGPNRYMITPEQRRFNNFLAIGHNVKAFLCWNYRSRFSDNQVANFNLMAWDGSATPRAKQHQDMAEFFNAKAEILNAVAPKTEVGVFLSDSLLLSTEANHYTISEENYQSNYQESAIRNSLMGAFRIFWDMNIPSDGINDCHLQNLSKYKVILLPVVENMSEKIAQVLKEYVAGGGILIAESPFAFKNENNIMNGRAPIYGLDEVFGCFTRDREGVETASDIVYNDEQRGKVDFLWHPYEITTGEIIAKYEDGRAAVVTNNYGKGKTFIFGTEVFRQCHNESINPNSTFIRKLILETGVKQNAKIYIKNKETIASNIEVCRLVSEKNIVYIVLNHEAESKEFTLSIADDMQKKWYNLENDEPIDFARPITLSGVTVLIFCTHTQH